MKTKTTEERFDVLIYERATQKVDTVAGEDMPMSEGSFHTAEKRRMTVMPRLNDHYGVCIVPAGIYKVGDIIKKEDKR